MSKAAKKSKSTARPSTLVPSLLLTDINDDCLTKILNYLDIASLIKVCKCSNRLSAVAFEHVIPFRTVDCTEFSKHGSVQKLFGALGQSITRLKFSSKDIQFTAPKHTRFMELLRLITQHGEPGLLKSFAVIFDEYAYYHLDEFPATACPFFGNVHSLEINLPERCSNSERFINSFPKENLCVLKVTNLYKIDNWLRVDSLPKLRELHLVMYKHRFGSTNQGNDVHLITYITAKPSLTAFHYVGTNSTAIFKLVSQYIPTIERLGNIEYSPIPRNDDNNNNNRPISIRERWQYLNEFKHLKFLSLDPYSPNLTDVGEVFRILANHNTIECLKLDHMQYHIHSVAIEDLKRFTSLTSLWLVDANKRHTEQFLNELCENLTGLKSCKFSGNKSIQQGTIINLIERVKNLRVLDIDCKVTSFSKLFYKKMIKTREAVIQNSGESLQPLEPIEVYINGAIASQCIAELGKKYQPSIIALRAKSV